MEESHSFSNIRVDCCVVGPLEVNCYIVWDVDSRRGVVIDPGGDGRRLVELIERLGVTPEYVINTHGHFDHIGADRDVAEAFSAAVVLHPEDLELFHRAPLQAEYFGLSSTAQPEPTVLVEDGMVLEAGPIALKVIHTPGHTPGSISLYGEKEGIVFTGDTLFQGSVGRTDLPGGSYEALISSIKERLIPLGDGVRVFSGHGPSTTIGEERRSNPFIAGV